MEFDDRNNKLKALQAELSSIELRRKQLMSEIKQLEVGHVLTTPIQARTISRNMNNRSSQQEKVRLYTLVNPFTKSRVTDNRDKISDTCP